MKHGLSAPSIALMLVFGLVATGCDRNYDSEKKGTGTTGTSPTGSTSPGSVAPTPSDSSPSSAGTGSPATGK